MEKNSYQGLTLRSGEETGNYTRRETPIYAVNPVLSVTDLDGTGYKKPQVEHMDSNMDAGYETFRDIETDVGNSSLALRVEKVIHQMFGCVDEQHDISAQVNHQMYGCADKQHEISA